MPTGYTCCINHDATFEQFVMQCARAFGALISLRDESIDTPLPDKIEPNPYHQKRISEITKELEELDLMGITQSSQKAEEEYDRELKSHQEAMKNHDVLRIKYEAMIEHVQNWQPPTRDHEPLKKFMLEQLQSSLDSDCDNDYYLKNPPVKLTGHEWHSHAKSQALKDLQYHEQKYKEDSERCQESTQWLQQLRQSLKPKPERPMRALELEPPQPP